MSTSETPSAAQGISTFKIPSDGFRGISQNWKSDLVSGLLVSLIALPLCLGIAMASGFPAFGGVVTAIIGGLVVGPLCGSVMTIKGPAAGLIAIAIASVEALGQGNNFDGYRYTLAVLVVASVIQVVFALCKLGRFGDFFPASAVHGMLAAIGIIIFSKQIHPLLGVKPIAKEPIGLIAEIPHSILMMNPEIGIVGILSVLIVLLAPKFLGKGSRYLPPALLAVLSGIALSVYFDISHPHDYLWNLKTYDLGEKYLVNLPTNFLAGITYPDFSKLLTGTSLQYIMMFALIGSLESLLTVQAVDSIDPYKRKANLNKDLLAVGFGNFLCALIGGLPMISEVVRSYANISYGAKSRWSNFFHGAFLLIYAVFLVQIIHLIPIAALAGILCVTGYRLAAPKHFLECKEIGLEQLIVFVVTILVTLSTDLLIGVAMGIVTEYVMCFVFGARPSTVFQSVPKARMIDGQLVFRLPEACTFSNIIGFKTQLLQGATKDIKLDFSETRLVDHTFMKEVCALEHSAKLGEIELSMAGLDELVPVGEHASSARRVASGERERVFQSN